MDTSLPIRLSELADQIYQSVNDSFGHQVFGVIAEISNYNGRSAKGYYYFDLLEKDEHWQKIIAKLSVTAWSEAGARINWFEKITGKRFENGLRVLVRVSVQFHSVYGLKLNLVDVDTSFTLGMIEQEKQRILQRLLQDYPEFIEKVADEYITSNKQLSFPKVISRVALVTSATAAGYGDFEHTLLKNQYNYKFKVDPYFTAMQGETRSGEIFATLLEIGGKATQYDAVVIARGGGAQTDLLIFDNYDLGKIIAQFPIPVITGIGHLRDETVVDLMAHSVTKSPTEAAKYIIEHNRAFEDHLNYLRHLIIIRSQQFIPVHRQHINRLQAEIVTQAREALRSHNENIQQCRQLVMTRSRQVINERSRRLFQLSTGLAVYTKHYFSSQEKTLSHLRELIAFADPGKILKRGFAMVFRDGKLIKTANEVEPGNDITIKFSQSALDAIITSKKISNGKENKL